VKCIEHVDRPRDLLDLLVILIEISGSVVLLHH
jgi:hypothetical protein